MLHGASNGNRYSTKTQLLDPQPAGQLQTAGASVVGTPRAGDGKGLALLSSRSIALLESPPVAQSKGYAHSGQSRVAKQSLTMQRSIWNAAPGDPAPPTSRPPHTSKSTIQSHRKLSIGNHALPESKATEIHQQLQSSQSLAFLGPSMDGPQVGLVSASRRAADRELAATSTAALRAITSMIDLSAPARPTPPSKRLAIGKAGGSSSPSKSAAIATAGTAESSSGSRDPWASTGAAPAEMKRVAESSIANALGRTLATASMSSHPNWPGLASRE